MEQIKGELARKLVEMQTDAEAKEILLTGIDCGWIELKIEAMTVHTITSAKDRKKRVKKAPNPLGDYVLSTAPGIPVREKRKARKTIQQKCEEFEKSYPELYAKAVENVGTGDMKEVLDEFKRLFKEEKKR